MLAAFCLEEPAKTKGRACFELRHVPKPTLEGQNNFPPGTVLIRIVASSICGSDLWGRNDETGRLPLDSLEQNSESPICGGTGHEVVGDVEEIIPYASGTTSLPIDQRVLALVPDYIRRIKSIRNTFETETKLDASVLPRQGGFAQYIITHSCACIALPSTNMIKNPLHYVVAQPLGTIIHACRKLGSVLGLNVAVVGQGQNGLIMTQLLANMGARRVIVLDLLQERLQVAKKSKATHTILCSSYNNSVENLREQVNHITNGEMCDITVEMVGHQGHTIDLCAQLTRDYGKVLLFGLPPAENGSCGEEVHQGLRIRYKDFTRNIQYVCSHSPSMDEFRLAVELIQQGRFDPIPLFTHSIQFEKFPEAYEMASDYKDGVIKILLTYQE